MKSASIFLSVTFLSALLLVSCSKDKADKNSVPTDHTPSLQEEVTNVDTNNENDTIDDIQLQDDKVDTSESSTNNTDTEESTDKPEEVNDSKEVEKAEKADESKEVVKDDKADRDPTATISNSIPAKYSTYRADEAGTIEHITYKTYDYFGNQAEITKPAYVYLPYNYDESKQYNVLYLMHGIGGNEKEWGMVTNGSKVKIMMDNLIYHGDIEPFIVVVPNGRSSVSFANTSSDHNSFYKFGQELRNDLIPYIESNYATHADYKEDGYDLSSTRNHRAMAGLSMGAMQTINIGICESLDILSAFGAFSACPTTYTAPNIASALEKFPDDDIRYFYNLCGLQDGVAITHASGAVNNLTTLTDKLTENENFKWQTVPGGHDFNVWYLGFYNFAQVAF